MSFEACAQIVEKADPERFAAAMSVPLDARRVLMPLYAFNTEIVRAPWMTQEPMIAEMRLQWWRDALEEIAEGGPVRRHEVTTPLAEVLPAEAARLLDDTVAARRWEVYRDPFADMAALEAYLTDTTGKLTEAAAMALGRPVANQRQFGFGVGLARFLAAVPVLIEQGRRPLPEGDLAALAARGRAALKGGSGPECVEGFLAAPLLKQVERNPGAVMDGLQEMAPLRRSLRLARAASGWLNYAS
ncbi:MAG: squalene/phytoene synthase family protein [Pseudomonadota bacterium]